MSGPTLTVKTIDVGWSYTELRRTKIVMIPESIDDNFPPDSLLQLKKERGEWGFMDECHVDFGSYQKQFLAEIEGAIANDTIIVAPEFSASPKLIEGLLSLKKLKTVKRCIVVGGSYYKRDGEKTICNVSPVILSDRPAMPVVHQTKFLPSPSEEPCGCHRHGVGVLNVFVNTGFGDFAIIICSDALRDELWSDIASKLRGRINLLIIVARNVSPALPQRLQKIADDERWIVCYCNGRKLQESSIQPPTIFSPFHSKHVSKYITRENNSYFLDFAGLNLATTVTDVLHSSTKVPNPQPSPPQKNAFISGKNVLGFPFHLKILAIGSHFEDIWLGCSATLMMLQEHYHAQIISKCLCKSYPDAYYGMYNLEGTKLDELKKALNRLCKTLGFNDDYFIENSPLQDRKFKENTGDLRKVLEDLKKDYCDIDLVFIPRQDDFINEDHMATAKIASSLFRFADVYEYEIKDFHRVPFKPNLLVNVGRRSNKDLVIDKSEIYKIMPGKDESDSFARKKAAILEKVFSPFFPERPPNIYDVEHCLGRMAFRAAESGKAIKYAEAFVADIVI